MDNTAITFELEVPSVEEFQKRITKTLERYPYLVAEEDGEVIAYAYAGIFYDRRAYDWSAEMSVYVQRGIHGKGVGTALYEKLEELLKKQNDRYKQQSRQLGIESGLTSTKHAIELEMRLY